MRSYLRPAELGPRGSSGTHFATRAGEGLSAARPQLPFAAGDEVDRAVSEVVAERISRVTVFQSATRIAAPVPRTGQILLRQHRTIGATPGRTREVLASTDHVFFVPPLGPTQTRVNCGGTLFCFQTRTTVVPSFVSGVGCRAKCQGVTAEDRATD